MGRPAKLRWPIGWDLKSAKERRRILNSNPDEAGRHRNDERRSQRPANRCHHRRTAFEPSLSPLRQDGTMLRQSLARSAWRTGKQSRLATRAFSATASRPAEVELTIGTSRSLPPVIDTWIGANISIDGKKVSIEGEYRVEREITEPWQY